MDYKLEDLIDVPLIQDLQEKLNAVYSFPSAIIDIEGKVLTAVAWQDICTKFHRVNPLCEKECIKSDAYIKEHLSEAKPAVSYTCPHGLIDNAAPIIIDGKHLGNFFTGQFFLEKPDLNFFKKQAKEFGFNEKEYLAAVKKVPVWTKDKIEKYLDFIKDFIEIVAGMGANHLKELELNKVLKEKEYRYRTIIDTSSDGFCITDKTGRVTDVNDTYCTMTGFSRTELLAMNILELEALESDVEIQEHMRDIMEKGNVRFESKYKRKDGSVVDVELSIHYDTVNGGQFVAFVHDISERKKAENSLRENEEKFRLIMENSSDTIAVLDLDLNFIYVSPSVVRLRGVTSEEAMKQKVQDIMTPESYRKVMEFFNSNIHKILAGVTENYPTIELEEYCKNGSTVWVELSFSILKDANGKPTGIITVTRNISERRKSESTLHDIIEKNPMSIQIVDLEGRSLKTNSAHTALFGAVPQPDFSIFKDLEQKGLGDFIALAKSGKEVHFPDLCYNVHDVSFDFPDNPTWIRSLMFPLNDSEGKPERFVIMHENVNDAKKAEQRLANQLLYTTALNQIAEVINSSDKPDEILSNSNRIVGETLKADRCVISDIAFDGKEITGLCEWHGSENSEIQSTGGNYPMEMFLSPLEHIRESETYLTSHSNNINEYYSKDGSGKILHDAFKVKSLIWYPLAFDKHGYYLLTINQILYHREWTKEDTGFLESVSKQVSLALMKIRILNERKSAEEALQNNHNLLLKLSNQVPGVIYQYRLYTDGSSCFPYSSNGMNDIYEYSPGDLTEDATPVFGRLHPEDIQMVSDLIFESAKTLELFVCEFRVVLPRQGLCWRYSNAVPERMEDGSTLWHGIIYDITDRKLTEFELIKEKEKAEELLLKTSQQKNEIILQNERLESLLRISQYKPASKQDLLDYALAEAIKLTCSKIGYIYYYNEDSKIFTLHTWSKEVMKECSVLNPQTLNKLDDTGCWGEAVRQRIPIIINDYKVGDEHIKGTPEGHVNLNKFLTIPVVVDNNIVAVVGVANKETDYDQSDVRQLTLLMDSVWRISERENMIDNLKDAKQKAEESDRLKSAFLANMSHEIRTPMNGILGFAQLLKEPKLTGEEQNHYIEIIEKSGRRMLNIINDIVDISRIESGQMKVSSSKTNISKQIEFLYIFFKSEVEAKGMVLNYNDPLPKKEVNINTDREKIYAILTNLVKNSIKYSNEGTIEFGYEKKGKFLEFFVKDTGIGIAEDRQKAIFERFVQADISDTRALQGAGLGLAITKAYVEMLGGKIWVESEEGKGSTFYFTIPYELSKDEHISIELKRKNDEDIEAKNLTILIAEDDKECELLLKMYLRKIGKRIISVNNGVDAVEAVRNNSDIDLIMMDIKMPDMDGYRATNEIRKINKDVIIIAQTAFALYGDREKSIEAGCNEYITKPINHNRLNELIENYFGGEHRKKRGIQK